MNHLALTPGLTADAELAYRRERLAADVAGAGRLQRWILSRRQRRVAAAEGLTLAA